MRLPAEDEWEYAARGWSGLRYAWGMEPDPARGNYADTQLQRTSTVGLFVPGEAEFDGTRPGLCDMSGNVWEWTSSLWGPDAGKAKFRYGSGWRNQADARENPQTEGLRVLRGGSWDNDAGLLRCAIRGRLLPGYRSLSLGFRVVLS